MPAQRMEAPITIREAVLNVVNNKYLLPAIQREYEWSAEKTVNLLDSLMRGYPVGSFLFWNVQPENSTKFRFYSFMRAVDRVEHTHLKPFQIVEPRALTVVLDGQQRLTSLTIALTGYRADKVKGKHSSNPAAYPRRYCYLNLAKRCDQIDDLDREFDFRFLTAEQANVQSADELWFKVADILSYVAPSGAGIDMSKLVVKIASLRLSEWGAGALGKLAEIVHSAQVIHYFAEDEQQLQRVLNVFIRLNSGGIPLSFSDLLLSVATAQWSTDAREAVNGVVRSLNGVGEGFEFSKDFVLKSALVLTDIQDIGFNADNFNRANTEKIEAGWETCVAAPLHAAVELASSLGWTNKALSSFNVLIPVAYYLKQAKPPANFLDHPAWAEDRQAIRQWLITSLLKSAFSAKTDTLLAACRSAIKAAKLADGFPLSDLQAALATHGVPLSFTDLDIDQLLEAEYGKRDTFSILAALYPSMSGQFKFHVDHIYPQAGFHKPRLRQLKLSDDDIEALQELRNQLPNLQLLTGTVNQSKLDTPFDEWTESMRAASTQQAWDQYRDLHAIPIQADYGMSSFSKFFDARRKALAERLRSALGGKPVAARL